ncbi:MAG: mechanosensitive ion channel family protein [Myxococcales bacterium]|nr:mechanosensitive ion channel family protein [Myxococcales bacterium]
MATVIKFLMMLAALGGIAAASRWAVFPAAWLGGIDKALVAALIGTLTWFLAKLCVRLLVHFVSRSNQTAAPIAGVVQNTVRISILVLGTLVILGTLGISITPLLTTVGIGGLAVALGLQDTLANLFAGVQIAIAGNIRVGDYVRLQSTEEGYVDDIRWRATRIRTLLNNCVIIPNSSLAHSIVTNFHLPARDLAVVVEVGVHYTSDLERVERVTNEVAHDIMANAVGGVPEFSPYVRFHGFAASSIDFSVYLRAREFADTIVVRHAFIKSLARRFTEEGIVIPFPIRAINLDQERNAQPLMPGNQASQASAGS